MDRLSNIVQLIGIVPDLVKQLEVLRRHRSLINALHHVRYRVAPLVAKVGRGEALQRRVSGAVANDCELLHWVAGCVRAERDLAAYPVGTFLRHCALGELVAQPNLKLRPRQARLGVPTGDEELAALLAELVRHLLRHERWRRKNELQLRNLLQLFTERLEREDRKRRCSDTDFGARGDLVLEIISEEVCDVIDDAQELALRPVRHVSGRAAASNPVVNLAGLELPQATDLVGGHALLSDPGVDGVLGDAKMNSDVVS
jgi:hypothetical protein